MPDRGFLLRAPLGELAGPKTRANAGVSRRAHAALAVRTGRPKEAQGKARSSDALEYVFLKRIKALRATRAGLFSALLSALKFGNC
jgi:hypothetical protein